VPSATFDAPEADAARVARARRAIRECNYNGVTVLLQ